MRVIAGEHGGRRLVAPAGQATRPTSDRVREALFSMLGPVRRARVLDLFAGSGALGIEALSRGAHSAVFVDSAPPAIAAIRANLEAVGAPSPRAQVRRADVAVALRAAREARETYDLVFVDAPYRHAADWRSELSAALPPLLGSQARVIVESARRAPLDLELVVSTERTYGDTLIRIHDPI